MKHTISMVILTFLVFMSGENRSTLMWEADTAPIPGKNIPKGSQAVEFTAEGKHDKPSDYLLQPNGKLKYQPMTAAEQSAFIEARRGILNHARAMQRRNQHFAPRVPATQGNGNGKGE